MLLTFVESSREQVSNGDITQYRLQSTGFPLHFKSQHTISLEVTPVLQPDLYPTNNQGSEGPTAMAMPMIDIHLALPKQYLLGEFEKLSARLGSRRFSPCPGKRMSLHDTNVQFEPTVNRADNESL